MALPGVIRCYQLPQTITQAELITIKWATLGASQGDPRIVSLQSDNAYHVADIMTPTAGQAMSLPDPNYPLVQMLQSYATFDWSPTFPLYMVGLHTDTLVSFNNTISAIKAMRGRGLTNAQVNYHGVVGPDLNHLTVTPGAAILARLFIDGGFAAVPTDADPS